MTTNLGLVLFLLTISVLGGSLAYGIIRSFKIREEAARGHEISAPEYDNVQNWIKELKQDFNDNRLGDMAATALKDNIIDKNEYEQLEVEFILLAKKYRKEQILALKNALPEIDPDVAGSWGDNDEIDHYEYDRVERWVEELDRDGVSGLNELVESCVQDGLITETEFKIIENRYTQLSAGQRIAKIRKVIGVSDDDRQAQEEHRTDNSRWRNSFLTQPAVGSHSSE